MAVEMKDPDGDQHTIPDAGVRAMEALGWRRVNEAKSQPRRQSKTEK